MKKVKYYYSPQTQQFEPLKTPLRLRLLRVFGLVSAILVASGIIVALAFRYLQSPNEKRMSQQLSYLQEKYESLRKDLKQVNKELDQLQQRDQEVYRVIFEAEQPSGLVVSDLQNLQVRLSPFSNHDLLKSMQTSLSELHQRIRFQQASYDSLFRFIEQKQDMLASIPSIQPVSNKLLERIASGFGARIDPIYKILKFHAGLDFTAPVGTPVYATGDGLVDEAGFHTGGYGNHVWIRHGFGYRSHYAHLVKIKIRQGQKVKRGEVIGWVGNTGKSTGPHCHYEVEKNGEKLDPVHFFYNDLNPEEFERVVQLAQAGNQSLD